MDEDPVDDVIPDSQETTSQENEHTDIFKGREDESIDLSGRQDPGFIDDVNSFEPICATSDSRNKEEPIRQEINSSSNIEKASNDRTTLLDHTSYVPRRFLRKRTAIQRMPYSLERIKHRQLLEGYDVSAFDTVSNQVDISILESRKEKEITDARADRLASNDVILGQGDGFFEYNSDISSIDDNNLSDPDDYDISIQEQNDPLHGQIPLTNTSYPSEDNQIGNLNVSDTEDGDDILFRGKRLKVKTGYRGILPKMVWEKELSSVGKKKGALKKHLSPVGGKGVAKKKKHYTSSNQDSSLLAELITDDVDNGRTNDLSIYHSVERNGDNISELTELDKYYRARYDDNYSTDSSFDDSSEYTSLFEPNDDKMTIGDDKSNNIGATTNTMNVPQLTSQYNDNRYALEDNGSEINPLLASYSRSKKDRAPRTNSLYTVSKRPTSVREKISTGRMKANVIKRISVKNYNGRQPIISIRSHTLTKGRTIEQQRPYIEQPGITSRKKKKERKENQYIANRNMTVYNIVVEASTGNFGTKPHRRTPTSLKDVVPREVITIPETPSLEVLDVFYKQSTLVPPETISFSLNNREFTLSRFNANEIEGKLERIFSSIIGEGSSEASLLEIFKQITNFLWQLNLPTLRTTIEQFHLNFREKLNSLRQNAKPIHFYILAACQLMLLEVSKYSNISLTYKEKIEQAILNHTASFFSILSVCYEKIQTGNTELLNQSYDMLATIIDALAKKDMLWTIFSEKKFVPEVVRFLTNIFPTREAQWDVIKIGNDFSSLRKTISLLIYCHDKLQWKIQDSVILKLHDIFKTGRFGDFQEERPLSNKNKVRTNPERVYACKTTFNGYLLLLSRMKISNSLLEKLTPISRMTKDDTIPAIINRLNLLALLAFKSNINYTSRFELIISQLLEMNFITNKSPQDVKHINESILNAVIFFILNNAKKKINMKYSVLSMVYQHITCISHIRKPLLVMFLVRLRQIVAKYKDIWKKISKLLFKCFTTGEKVLDDTEIFSIFLELYMHNLTETNPKWIHTNLFPLLKERAETSIVWVEIYCQIGAYLIKNGELSWWQFLTFNGLDKEQNIRYYYNYKVVELCDFVSFNNLQRDFYSLLVDDIDMSTNDPYFWQFCKRLLQKTESNTIDFAADDQSLINCLPLWRKLFKKLGNMHYNDLIRSLVRKISLMYSNNIITTKCMHNIVIFLDAKFTEFLQDMKEFSHLRTIFNISNQEIENNKFKDKLRSLPDLAEQVIYITKCVVDADDQEISEKKILSLFSSPKTIDLDAYKILTIAIMGNSVNGAYYETDDFGMKTKVSHLFLRIIIKANLERFYQLEKGEYLELFNMARFLYMFFDFTARVSPVYSLFINDCRRFIAQMTSISMGFIEGRILSEITRHQNHSMSLEAIAEYMDVPSKDVIDKLNDLYGKHKEELRW